MADYFLVRLSRGVTWDHSRPRRSQARWDEHAVFMDALTAEGVVVLGGPVGEGDGEDVLLVVNLRTKRRSAPSSPTTPGRTTCC